MTGTIQQPNEALRRRTGLWVLGIGFFGLLFDGYDLVVYGTVVSTLIRDPEWALTPAQAGAIGSYALFGMMTGAIVAGAIGDYVGRRRLLLAAIAWFSIGMAFTAMAPSVTLFGLGRFVTGIGIGALVAAAGATVAEFAPPGKRNLYNAIVFAGYPAGGVVASLTALGLLQPFGFRTLFWIGALPLVTLLPIAYFKLPESPAWLLSRGRVDEANAASLRTGVPLPIIDETPATNAKAPRSGFAGIFTRKYAVATILIGLMSAGGLMLTYALNTWLPELMVRNGYGTQSSLLLLLLLNAGAIIGSLFASRFADRFGAKIVIVTTFSLAAEHRHDVQPGRGFDLDPDTLTAPRTAALLRRHRWSRDHRHTGADLWFRVQLLPDQQPSSGRCLGSRLRPARGNRRTLGRRVPAHRRAGYQLDLPHLRGCGGAGCRGHGIGATSGPEGKGRSGRASMNQQLR